MPPLGHRGKLILQTVSNMFHDHNQVLYGRMNKQDEWHRNMYEMLATTTSNLAYKQDMLWENVANFEGSMRDPSMQERHRGVVSRPMIREMLAWEELPVIPPPYPPP